MRFPTSIYRLFLAVATAGAILAPMQSEARSSFDGQWTIRAAASPGGCTDRYQMTIRVADGHVIYRGLLAAVASGTVRGDGRITMQLGEARVTGRLGGDHGGGSWASPRCRGAWTASRA
jgi:hypothetical protein